MGGILFPVFLWILNDIKSPLFYIRIVFLNLAIAFDCSITVKSYEGEAGEEDGVSIWSPAMWLAPKHWQKWQSLGPPWSCDVSKISSPSMVHGISCKVYASRHLLLLLKKAVLWRNRRTDKGFLWILSMSVVWLLLQCVMNLWKILSLQYY